jgi:protein tyrosine phosphatase (PTP) superfamily phosphohydrolase (DUF442 family)
MKRALLLLALLSCSAPAEGPIHRPGLDNAHWLTDTVISGAQPEGDAAFRELADLGVKTLISVDGLKPDLESAHKYGMRYVHLPIGYDGVPKERALELAKAIRELPGSIYVHCHHGRHRGPAAAVVACVVAGKMDNGQAIRAMEMLGTGPQYIGLWASARESKGADAAELRDLKVEFRETSPIPPLADAMVGLDTVFERLLLCREAGWRKPPGHPDIDPPHEALRLREICVEILRTEECRTRPSEFRAWMERTKAESQDLEVLLRSSASPERAERALAALQQSCTDCHQPYRNVKSRR